jgi:hypothetical protein
MAPEMAERRATSSREISDVHARLVGLALKGRLPGWRSSQWMSVIAFLEQLRHKMPE